MQNIIIEPITTKKQYENALEKIELLIDCKEGSKEEQYLEAISILVHEYEKKQYPILPLDPIESIKYKMQQSGLSQQDIAKYFGGKNRASEVLNGKRKLTLKMVKALYNNLQIPAEVLLSIS
ncbi:MAG TPA: helix-turn-helix domain-containing protein [Chitinophagales bacterium]|nr:helix-turn-helix domain-containing protein [Chitinophagales bacterium]